MTVSNIVNPMFVIRRVHPTKGTMMHTLYGPFASFDRAQAAADLWKSEKEFNYVVFACQPVYDTRDH